MAVKMRLMRMGKKKAPYYRVVVIDGRAPRDGRYIDLLGRYDPNPDPSLIEIDDDKAVDWLRKGAQPTDAVRKLLEISGAMSKFKVASGRIHTVASQPAPAPAIEEPAEEPAAEEAAAEEPAAIAAEEPTADETAADVAEDDAGSEEE